MPIMAPSVVAGRTASRMRILIVEDESLLANRLATTLGERGYAVDVARDGERGDFLASTEHSDAVILSISGCRVSTG